ncbi:MAG: permease-like cell division protein FtsX [Clostridia bacterium]|nr:permease-like cell division protein FtsX [Clostridia bacterium]
MNKQYSLLYFISQTFKGLFRNGVMSLASVLVLVSMLSVMGGFWLLVRNIDSNVRSLEIMNDIVIMLEPDATDEEIRETDELLGSMKKYGIAWSLASGDYEILRQPFAAEAAEGASKSHIDLEIETLKHVTKKQALEELKASDPDLYSDINDENNPLPDKFVITYGNSEKVETITTAVWSINKNFSHDVIKSVKGYEQLVNTVSSVRNGIMYIFTWFLIILAVVSVFIIINTVKLSVYSRRQEIMIMRYVGASKWFITLPFLGEGFVIGAFSAGVAFFIEKYAYQGAVKLLSTSDSGSLMNIISIVPFGDVSLAILFAFLGIGILAGVIGSSISLYKYVKT